MSGPLWGSVMSLHDAVEYALCHNLTLKAQEEEVTSLGYLEQQRLCEIYLPKVSLEGGVVQDCIEPNPDHYSYGFLLGQWNLYRGGKDYLKRTNAHLETSEGCLQAEKDRKRLMYDVHRVYYELLALRQTLESHKNSLEINTRYAAVASRKVECGLTSEAEVLEFDLRANDLETQMVGLSQHYRQKQGELATLMDFYEEPIDPCGDFPPRLGEKKREEWVEQALSCREDMRQSALKVALTSNRYGIAASGYSPSVDLTASYGYQPGDWEDRGHGASVTLSLSVPLMADFAVNRERRMLCHRAAASRYAAEQLKHAIPTQVALAIDALEALEEQLAAVEKRSSRMQKYWSVTLEEFHRGVKSAWDLTYAANALLASELQLIDLNKEYALALIHLSDVIGLTPDEIAARLP